MTKLITVFLWIYMTLCLLSLLIIPVSIYGWFSVERTALGSVFAIMLAFPWSLALSKIGYHGTPFVIAILLFGMAFNIFLLLSLRRQFRR